MTALDVEHAAVLEHLVDVRPHRHPAGTVFDVGTVAGHPGHRVALTMTGAGTTAAATLTERANAEFAPTAMVFVGVAGGLRDWLAIGDVVVATKIYSYQGGRSENDEFLVRPSAWSVAHRLDQEARRLLRGNAWHSFLPDRTENDPPVAYFEPIAVGDVVLNSRTSELARRLHTSYNDAVAIEMEGSGFAHAAHLGDQVRAVSVRGISDHADGGKAAADRSGGQRLAARNAAAFAIALITALEPDEDTPGGEEPPPPAVPVIHNTNTARDNARVGQQIGVNFGSARRFP
ncbi:MULTISPECIES: 5'-methylthioadenosine/S-adenosylhomocysteine nucleosidase [unclassified Crossiella]|uniref:5'-methylthioadenosine/S-adenosylhomocysteine nucleosidase n=1 Tax=unclassified Crossiella TaxID=2620835 RepID=UPI001FFF7230|nr:MULTISPECIES: 5'-methylthioadenosine/S-adenosylhomocysteine nucleosidase [unclassified Crossiella]MCK2237401.1 5'-methylthioadenosine/S-adenosylhomocysteine nucleosidase [Crossiella sp. S99.2]MCK2251056.1 5'-methylthioadenosine/S-adenosylhomocysteine nucleosidase [Crossiella sp. S99.1]